MTKVLIFNSGTGSRLGGLTTNSPKSMVTLLSTGETVFERQLRQFHERGFREFVITTGPHAEQLVQASAPYIAAGCSITFVPNLEYASTNYIYSMYLASEYLVGNDCIMLHGDLVFDDAFLNAFLTDSPESYAAINAAIEQPEKDFKARIHNGFIVEVSVDIFDDDCIAFQPIYKLSEFALKLWIDRVALWCERGERGVYAENAANKVFKAMELKTCSYEGHLVAEIDTVEDLIQVSLKLPTK